MSYKLESGLYISIHALREEGDSATAGTDDHGRHFYPRPPRGGRPLELAGLPEFLNFYPRPPRGGRHRLILENRAYYIISIHALREEGDCKRLEREGAQ